MSGHLHKAAEGMIRRMPSAIPILPRVSADQSDAWKVGRGILYTSASFATMRISS